MEVDTIASGSTSKRRVNHDVMGMNVIYEPNDGDTEVDIVAVHGLNGGSEKTWFHAESNTMWLRDLLPKCLPTARIMTFGYDVKLCRSKISARLEDHARVLLHGLSDIRKDTRPHSQGRPIIFICHSLGGLVIKEALCIASIQDTAPSGFVDILESTFGIMFFGTPHRGSKFGDAASVLSYLPAIQATDMATFLRLDAKHLEELNEKFRNIVNRFVVKSFYELGRMVRTKKVVERDSAVLKIAGGSKRGQEEQIPLELDHRAMCRYPSLNDQAFRKVLNAITDILRQAAPIAGEVQTAAASSVTSTIGVQTEEIERSAKYGPSSFHSENRFTCEDILDALCLQFSQADIRHDLAVIPDASEGTCQWLQKLPEFVSWGNGPVVSTFLLTGKMGSGKSVMAKAILLSDLDSGGDRGEVIAYYFCSRVKRPNESAQGLLMALIYQLAAQTSGSFKLKSQFGSVKKLPSWPVKHMWDLFEELIQKMSAPLLCCYIDGLDECDKASITELLRCFRGFCHSPKLSDILKVKFFITARSNTIDLPEFRNIPGLIHVFITPEMVESDIQQMIESDVEEIIYDLELPMKGTEQSILLRELATGAKGMFIWAKIVLSDMLQNLERSRSFESILAEVQLLSGSLQELYQQALDRIWEGIGGDSEKREVARRVIAWTLLATRPLTLAEMVMAVSITEGSTCLPSNTQQRTSLKHFIANNLKPLIEVVHDRQQPILDNSNATIRPIHESVRQFLMRVCIDHHPGSESGDYYIGRSGGHEIIARACFAYIGCKELQVGFLGPMCKDEFGRIVLNDEVGAAVDKFLERHVLVAYCADEWNIWRHLRQCKSEGDGSADTFDAALKAILIAYEGLNLLSQVHQVLWRRKKQMEEEPLYPKLSQTHLATRSGSLEIIKRYVAFAETVDFNVEDDGGATPLITAVAHHADDVTNEEVEKVFYYLLDNGADPTMTTRRGISLSHICAFYGRVAILQRLLSNGVPINNQTNTDSATMLHLAVARGHIEAVRLLLEAGADCEIPNKMGTTPLILACLTGNIEAVQLLLQYSADTTAADTYGFQPLHGAIISKSANIVKTLLQHNAPPGAEGKYFQKVTPLHIAADLGDANIIQLLVKAKASLASRTDFYPDRKQLTPLHVAIIEGNVETVKALCELGAEVDALAGDGASPLLLAYRYWDRNSKIIEVLLSHGACAYRTFQPYTLQINLVEAVLLDHFKKDEVEVLRQNIPDGKCGFSVPKTRLGARLAAEVDAGFLQNEQPPVTRSAELIHAATWSGDVGWVKALLDHGANLETKGPMNATPLHFAVLQGSLDMVKVLVNRGADCNATTDPVPATPMQLAINRKCDTIVEFLLEHQVDANGQPQDDKNLSSPLHLAVISNSQKICEMLFEHGANIHCVDRLGLSCLSLALVAQRISTEIIRYLVEKGAVTDLSAKGSTNPINLTACLATGSEALETILTCASSFISHDICMEALSYAIQLELSKNVKVLLEHTPGYFSLSEVSKLHETEIKSKLDKMDPSFALKILTKSDTSELCAGNEWAWPVLYSLIIAGEFESAQSLIARGVGDGVSNHAPLAIHLACNLISKGGTVDNLRRLEFLVDNKIISPNDDSWNEIGVTLAHTCALVGSPEMANLLLKKDVDFSKQVKGGKTCLHLAAGKGSLDMCRTLAEPRFNIDLLHKNNEQLTALHNGLHALERIQALVEGAGSAELLKLSDLDVLSLLVSAAIAEGMIKNNAAGLRWLLSRFTLAQISCQTETRKNLLHLVLQYQPSKAVVSALLDVGVDSNLLNAAGLPPIVQAIDSGNISACEGFISHSSWDPSRTHSRGRTFLHDAAEFGKFNIASLLLQGGAKAVLDRNGWSPLDVAIQQGYGNQIDEDMRLNLRVDSPPHYRSPSILTPELHTLCRMASTRLSAGKIELTVEAAFTLRIDNNSEEPFPSSAISDYCIPPDIPEYYFEVEILEDGGSGFVGIGLLVQGHDLFWHGMPGWFSSYGYYGRHGKTLVGADTGTYSKCNAFTELVSLLATVERENYGPPFTKGDRVGCGLDQRENNIYYTKNGEFLGIAHRNVRASLYPMVGLVLPGSKVHVTLDMPPPPRTKGEKLYHENRGWMKVSRNRWRGIFRCRLSSDWKKAINHWAFPLAGVGIVTVSAIYLIRYRLKRSL